MNHLKINRKASWLHVSDLHVFPEADTTLMLEDYKELAKVISPQFLLVTGDFRHQRYQTDFSYATKYLESLINVFHIDKKDIFLVPGNHDATQYDGRADAITDICKHTDGDYNVYSKYALKRGFFDYDSFVHKFYEELDEKDIRKIDPSGVHCVVWNDLINILYVNTALISDGEEHGQIIDMNALSQCKVDFKRPTIMIGHHEIDSLFRSHSERVKGIMDRRKISTYLHGDTHRYANHPIMQISTPNRTIPSITCAKSAPQSGDSYSDIGVIYYEWRTDDNTYVQAYRWSPKGFVEDSSYYYGIDKRYFFPMVYDSGVCVEEGNILYGQIKSIMDEHKTFMCGNWVREAENIWKANRHEGIGRCLLLFYFEKAEEGAMGACERAKEIYHELGRIPNQDINTQKMLEATESLLLSDKY